MTEQDRLRTVTLFFYFSYLDETQAIQSAQRTNRLIAQASKRSSEFADFEIVGECLREWQRVRSRKKGKIQAAISFNAGWILPAEIDLGPWKSFVRACDPDEYLAVLWINILKFPEVDVAKALNVSVGTLRHRLARGLRNLSAIGLSGQSAYV